MNDQGNMNNVSSVGELINKLLNAYQVKSKFNEVKLRHAWELIMPQAIITRTSNLYFRNETLYIKVISAPLREELTSMESQLIENLNQELGSEIIKRVKIS